MAYIAICEANHAIVCTKADGQKQTANTRRRLMVKNKLQILGVVTLSDIEIQYTDCCCYLQRQELQVRTFE